MSGIAGIIHFDGAPIEPGLIEKMTSAMPYRGPDGINHWVKGSVALGQCMLRTTPESLEETQPLTNEDESLVLVMDGRVDNWEELRRELLGRSVVLRSRSDAELVLRAYEVWGQECLPHIVGDFALVIWDSHKHKAFCARDRMGNKPFNYHWDGNRFCFCSELQPIFELPWVRQIPNEEIVSEFLTAEWYSKDETLWRSIVRLVAAHYMIVDKNGACPKKYWTPDLWTTISYSKDEEYIEHYRELLIDNIRRLSRSHKPVAIEISGGLDSSAVLCVAEHLRRKNKLPAPCIEGYTLAFANGGEADELSYAQIVGDYLGVCIHEVLPTIRPLSWYAEHARTHPSCPAFPNGVMLHGLRLQAAQRGSRAILNGIGGDEWIGGSRLYYAEELSQQHWSQLYECFKADIAAFGILQAVRWLIRYGCLPLMPTTVQAGLHSLARIIRGNFSTEHYWLTPAMRSTISLRRKRSRLEQLQPVKFAGQRELLDLLHAGFRDMAKEEDDRINAVLGIEARRPLDSSELVQFAFSIPERLRMRGDMGKYIHRQALQELMPQEILDRKSKAEFAVVFRTYLDQMQEIFTSDIPRKRREWITTEGMAQLFHVYKENPQLGWPIWILWSIYGCVSIMQR
jgi:asparagine synthase (glutamine-hydrolysing)